MNIIGHETILERLTSWVDRDALPHALLFVGPPSVGKRRVAHWLADRLTKDHPEHVIILEQEELRIDAVRMVRQLATLTARDNVPHVVILDGLAAMTAPAANALLKTLEEPRGDVIFVLIAHGDGNDILPTIRSRSATIRFLPVPEDQIAGGLVEHYDMSVAEAEVVARRCCGAPGRALARHQNPDAEENLLPQLASLAGEPIVHRFSLVKDVVDGEREQHFLEEALLFFRDVMLFQEGCDDLVAHRENVAATEQVARHVAGLRIRRVLDAMMRAEMTLQATSVNKRLALEQALLLL